MHDGTALALWEGMNATTNNISTYTRETYLTHFENKDSAIEFETACLSIGTAALPAFAAAVRDGAEPAPEYWAWLIGQLEEQDRQNS